MGHVRSLFKLECPTLIKTFRFVNGNVFAIFSNFNFCIIELKQIFSKLRDKINPRFWLSIQVSSLF